MGIGKIISGGQTGADRGALEAAVELGVPHGGFCPRGRRAEDGRVPEKFQLEETATDHYAARTSLNVRAGDATLLLVHGRQALARSRGTKLTLELCLKYGRPWWAADPRRDDHVERVVAWLEEISPGVLARWDRMAEDAEPGIVLNVAGPRESRAPGIQRETANFVGRVVRRLS